MNWLEVPDYLIKLIKKEDEMPQKVIHLEKVINDKKLDHDISSNGHLKVDKLHSFKECQRKDDSRDTLSWLLILQLSMLQTWRKTLVLLQELLSLRMS